MQGIRAYLFYVNHNLMDKIQIKVSRLFSKGFALSIIIQ